MRQVVIVLAGVPVLLGALLVLPAQAVGGLDTLAAARGGRSAGVALQGSKLTDATYTGIADREFGVVTPENELRLDATEPARGQFNFVPADRVVDWAQQHGKAVHGSSLIWHSANPGWVQNLANADDALAALRGHIGGLLTHYRGRVASWDVVAEAFTEAGRLRPSTWQSRIGDSFIEQAFVAARQTDPAARLCYEEYGIEDWNAAKTQAVYAMVRDFRARGVPIDCVDLEAHFVGGAGVPAGLQTTLTNFAALGVDVRLSQLDITNAAPTPYTAAVNACLAVPRCTGFTVWGVRDTDSWRSSETPVLFDGQGNAKPAYYAVVNALGGELDPTTTTTVPTTTTTTTPTVPTTTTTVPTTTTTTTPTVPTTTTTKTTTTTTTTRACSAGYSPWPSRFGLLTGQVTVRGGRPWTVTATVHPPQRITGWRYADGDLDATGTVLTARPDGHGDTFWITIRTNGDPAPPQLACRIG